MLISIITINYNNLEGLKKTMESVFVQTHKEIEYIVIDGNSTDGSVDFIESKGSSLAYWISEPDQGIYDAMNKGIEHATGDYLLFLNSGDWLANAEVITKFVAFNPIESIVYGDPLVRTNGRWRRKYMPKKISVGVALTTSLNHQAEFYHNDLFNDNFRYDITYRCSADRHLTNTAIIFKNCTTRYIDLIVCYFEDPGVSSDYHLRVKERRRYLKENFDPLFLSLLTDYQQLNSEHQNMKKSSTIQFALWLLKKRAQMVNYFKINT